MNTNFWNEIFVESLNLTMKISESKYRSNLTNYYLIIMIFVPNYCKLYNQLNT